MSLGDKLLALRKQNKMTQEEVANILDVTRQTISNWELNQTKPDIDQLKGLSKLYNMSIDELMDHDVREMFVEKISNTEKLAGLIYKILKWLMIILLALFGLSIIGMILFTAIRKEVTHHAKTEISCKLNDIEYLFEVNSTSLDHIEVIGDIEMIEEMELDNSKNEFQTVNLITEYFEKMGGHCE